jgi:hypothetical protein
MSKIYPNLDDVPDLDEYDTDSSEEETALKFGTMYMNCWEAVSSFSHVPIYPNTIVFCDIDDTIIHHPRLNYSWIQMLSTFFTVQYLGSDPPQYDERIPLARCNAYINNLMNTTHPVKQTDSEGFNKLVNSSAHFVLITARDPSILEITRTDLSAAGIDPDTHPLHFSSKIPKGNYIMENFDLSKYEHVVFIDDQLHNLINVKEVVQHPGLKIYKYEHAKEHPYDYYPLPEGIDPCIRFNGYTIDRLDELDTLCI